jgi:hypothetical protein
MPHNIASALENLVPNPDYFGSLTDNTQDAYNAITWNDTRVKPSWDDVLTEDANVYKAYLKLTANVYRNNRVNGGFTYRAMVFNSDYGSINALSNAYILATGSSAYSVQWKLKDGTFVNLNSTDIIQLYTAIHAFSENLYNAEATADAGIDAGTVVDEIGVSGIVNSVPNSV